MDWATPIVPVPKTDGSVRICGDYKITVNQVAKLDKYPIPRIEDLFASLAGGKAFSKLDLSQAYQQIELDEESRQYVTINTHKGLFRYNRLPFGVASAPSIFQRIMENILQACSDTTAKAAVEDQLKEKDALSFIDRPHSPEELTKLLSQTFPKYASSDRIELIKKGLQIPTYRLNFRHEKGDYYVDITRGGEKYQDSIKLDSTANADRVSGLQIASILVEAVVLLLSIAGIVVPEEKIAEVAARILTVISESPAVQEAMEVLKNAWGSGGSGKSKASAVWDLIKAVWEYRTHGNIIIQIVKPLLMGMSWWHIAKSVVVITAMIVAAIASGGAALVAKIVLALNSAYEFGKKIHNLNELDGIRTELQI